MKILCRASSLDSFIGLLHRAPLCSFIRLLYRALSEGFFIGLPHESMPRDEWIQEACFEKAVSRGNGGGGGGWEDFYDPHPFRYDSTLDPLKGSPLMRSILSVLQQAVSNTICSIRTGPSLGLNGGLLQRKLLRRVEHICSIL